MIKTVTGNICREDVKNVLMHEHIQVVSNDLIKVFGNRWQDREAVCESAVNILSATRQKFGVNLLVDGTPLDLGRDVGLLREVSQRSGVYIAASTGFYYYPSMISEQRSAEELCTLVMREIEDGMEEMNISPGILKCAVDRSGITADTKKRLSAMGQAQAKSGLALYAHCMHVGDTARDLIEVLSENGADIHRVILGHASRRLDAKYLKSILSQGVYICIDQSNLGSEGDIVRLVYELCADGYERKLLFSHDRAIRNDFKVNCHSRELLSVKWSVDRFSFLFEVLTSEFCRIGCTDEQCNRFLRENALDLLDFSATKKQNDEKLM